MTLLLILFVIYITGVVAAWFKLYWHHEDAVSKCYDLTDQQRQKIRRSAAFSGCWRSWMPVIFLRR